LSAFSTRGRRVKIPSGRNFEVGEMKSSRSAREDTRSEVSIAVLVVGLVLVDPRFGVERGEEEGVEGESLTSSSFLSTLFGTFRHDDWCISSVPTAIDVDLSRFLELFDRQKTPPSQIIPNSHPRSWLLLQIEARQGSLEGE
jgi:hypothetical protein